MKSEIKKPIVIFFVSLVSILIPLLAYFGLLYGNILSGTYQNISIYNILIFAIYAFLFYASFLLYQSYRRTKRPGTFFVSLGFCAAGVTFFAHALFLSGFFYSATLGDITEHWGLVFFAVFVTVAFFAPFAGDWVYKFRFQIMAANSIFIVLLILFLASFPLLAEIVAIYANVAGLAAGMMFLLLIIFLINERLKNNTRAMLFLVIAFGILASTGIMPFFYEPWGAGWWFFYLTILAGCAFAYFGFREIARAPEEMGEAQRYKELSLSVKIYASLLSLVFFSVIASGYTAYLTAKQNLKQHIIDDMVLVAESKEEHFFSFMDKSGGRAADFASDGFIRDSVSTLIKTKNEEIRNELNRHLRENKMVLDETVVGINVVNADGKVIASTAEGEIGKDESDDDYFIGAKNLKYGEYYIGSIKPGHHFGNKITVFAASSPITEKISGERLGVLVNYINLNELSDIMKGLQQIELGAISGALGRGETVDIYLVGKDRTLLTEARAAHPLEEKINTEPVKRCEQNGEEFSGIYKNYRGVNVVGATMCFSEIEWDFMSLVVEVEESEAFAILTQIGERIILLSSLVLFMVLLAAYLLIKSIISPIANLTSVSRKISAGDFGARAAVESQDEIGELASAFNGMLDKLLRAQEEISLEREKLEVILDSIPVPVDIINKNWEIQYANTAFKKTFHCENKCIGKTCFSQIRRDKIICEKCPLNKGLEEIKGTETIEIVGPNGDEGRTFLGSHAAFKDPSGELFAIEAFIIITERKKVDKMKSEFISIASHQLRTPLTTIRWVAEALLKKQKDLSLKSKEYLRDIHLSSSRLSDLVDLLLNASRIEEGKMSVSPHPFDLVEFMEKYLEEISPLYEEKGVIVLFSRPKKMDITSDESAIRLIVQSIISNAVEYTPSGGRVDIKLEGGGPERFLLKVKDTGIGIPKDEQEHISQKFVRGSNAKLVKTGGTGLGLFTAYRAAEMLGGKIWFISPVETKKTPEGKEEKIGTEFFIELPLKSKPQKDGKGFVV